MSDVLPKKRDRSGDNSRERVARLTQQRKELGLVSVTLWIPASSKAHFNNLALVERIKCNIALPSDLTTTSKLVVQPDMFGSAPSIKADDLATLIKSYEAIAHPTSPRWEYGRRILKDLKELLDNVT